MQLTTVLDHFKQRAIEYANDCVGTGLKNADLLVLDCSVNNLDYSSSELKSILDSLDSLMPELEVEIWTKTDIISKF